MFFKRLNLKKLIETIFYKKILKQKLFFWIFFPFKFWKLECTKTNIKCTSLHTKISLKKSTINITVKAYKIFLKHFLIPEKEPWNAKKLNVEQNWVLFSKRITKKKLPFYSWNVIFEILFEISLSLSLQSFQTLTIYYNSLKTNK